MYSRSKVVSPATTRTFIADLWTHQRSVGREVTVWRFRSMSVAAVGPNASQRSAASLCCQPLLRVSNDKKPSRQPIEIATQAVLYRSNWLCHWCGRPVIFAPALKYLGQFVESRGFSRFARLHDVRYRRDASPLLDGLGLISIMSRPIRRSGEHSKGSAS